jgi:hypothetical protein
MQAFLAYEPLDRFFAFLGDDEKNNQPVGRILGE